MVIVGDVAHDVAAFAVAANATGSADAVSDADLAAAVRVWCFNAECGPVSGVSAGGAEALTLIAAHGAGADSVNVATVTVASASANVDGASAAAAPRLRWRCGGHVLGVAAAQLLLSGGLHPLLVSAGRDGVLRLFDLSTTTTSLAAAGGGTTTTVALAVATLTVADHLTPLAIAPPAPHLRPAVGDLAQTLLVWCEPLRPSGDGEPAAARSVTLLEVDALAAQRVAHGGLVGALQQHASAAAAAAVLGSGGSSVRAGFASATLGLVSAVPLRLANAPRDAPCRVLWNPVSRVAAVSVGAAAAADALVSVIDVPRAAATGTVVDAATAAASAVNGACHIAADSWQGASAAAAVSVGDVCTVLEFSRASEPLSDTAVALKLAQLRWAPHGVAHDGRQLPKPARRASDQQQQQQRRAASLCASIADSLLIESAALPVRRQRDVTPADGDASAGGQLADVLSQCAQLRGMIRQLTA
jgi:hypothetical protein